MTSVERIAASEARGIVRRGPRYKSRRYEHDRTGEPMPAYLVGGYVVEKNRRDWNHRVPGRAAAMWVGPKEWWEVRKQGSNTQPGVSIGRNALYDAATLRECVRWIEDQTSNETR